MSTADPKAVIAGLLPSFTATPELHLHRLNRERRRVLLVRMQESDYRRESFLDERMVTPDTVGGWATLDGVLRQHEAWRAGGGAPNLHFILHQGHTGSTMVSRMLDATGAAFGLREPQPLRTLAEFYDTGDRQGIEELQDLLLMVWSRRFRPDVTPIVKATSHAGRIGADLLRAAPAARALSLYLKPEPYLAVLLAGANTPIDLQGFAEERRRRATGLFGADLAPASSLGELGALAWLTERSSQTRCTRDQSLAPRTLDLDFDDLLRDPAAHLSRIARHFALGADEKSVQAAAAGPLLTRYSKATDQAYSPDLRRADMDEARAAHGEEIRRGLAWLEAVGKRSEAAARVMAG